MFINGFPIIMRLTLRTGDLNFFTRQAHRTRTAYSLICRTKGKRRHLLAGITTIEDTSLWTRHWTTTRIYAETDACYYAEL